MPEDATDQVLEALEEVVDAIAANIEVNRAILRRAKELQRSRQRGKSWTEIVSVEGHPLVVEMLRANQERLAVSGARFRRAQAEALRAEGCTLDQIASYFGVTRPRVIALLRAGRESAGSTR